MNLVRGKHYGRAGFQPPEWKKSFEVVFVEGKGFKWVTQIEKDGVKFEPRESVYSPFMVQYIDLNGNNRMYSIPLNCWDDVLDLIRFLQNNKVDFTEEESKFTWICVITVARTLKAKDVKKDSVDEFLRSRMVGQMIDMYYRGESINSIEFVGITLNK